MARKRFLLVAAVAAMAAVCDYACAGVISVVNYDKNGVYSSSECIFKNIQGGQEGFDENDHAFSSEAELEVFSNEPGFKADVNAKPQNTFGWLFSLGAKTAIEGANNCIKFKVDDATDISKLIAYDLQNPSVIYEIPLFWEEEIAITPSSASPGEYAHWKMDIINPGDANFDGKVNDLDASILAANWQKMGPECSWRTADFNGDFMVNDLDASILAAYWQSGVIGPNAVPEPSTGLMIIIALIAICAAKKRK